MKTLPAATAIACALLAATIMPATSASAADSSVSGTVTLDGAPIGGVEVGWYDPTTDAAGETVADAAGAYSLTVPDGHPYVLYAGIDHKPSPPVQNHGPWEPVGKNVYVGVFLGAIGPDYLYQGRTSFTGPQAAANIDLDKPGSISVTDKRFARQRLTLRNTGPYRGDGLGTAKADANGTATFAGLVPGNYTITDDSFPTNGYAPWHSPVIAVAAGAVSTTTPVLQKAGSIVGTVTNKGKPLKGISVVSYRAIEDGYAYGSADVTDGKGKYTLKNETAGKYLVVLEEGSDDGALFNRPILYLTKHTTVASGEKTTLRLKARKGGSVSGSVTPTAKGSFEVRVLDSKGRLTGGGVFEAKSTSAPTPFTLTAVKPGASTIVVTDAQRKVYASVRLTVRPGVANRTGALRFTKKSITVKGRVTGVASGAVTAESVAYGINYSSGRIHNGKYIVRNVFPVPGTSLRVQSVKYTVTRSAKLASKSSGSQNLKAGVPLGSVTGSIVAGGFPLHIGGTIAGMDQNDVRGRFSTSTGPFTAKHVIPGTGTFDIFFDSVNTDSDFVVGSPFWLSVPADRKSVTVKSGANTDVGTLDLVVNR